MKDKLIIVTILLKPWVLGLIPAIAIIMLLPELSSKYKLEQVKIYDNSMDKMLTFFEDIDGDTVKEKFDILNYDSEFASCIYSRADNSYKCQISLFGKVMRQPNSLFPIYCDVTKDGVKEIFTFMQKRDTIWLTVTDLTIPKKILFKRYISPIGINCKKDFDFRPLINHDNNNDGVPEIYFEINGGFSLYPRLLFVYDFANDSLKTTFNSGSPHHAVPFFNASKELRFYSATRAVDNWTSACPYPYIDTNAWLFGFDDKLELLFEPKHFNGYSAFVNGPIFHNNEIQYCVLHEYDSTRTKKLNYFVAYDEKGQLLRKNEFTKQIEFEEFEAVVYENENRYIINCTEDGLPRVYEYFPGKMEIGESELTKKINNLFCYPFKLDENTLACIAFDPKSDDYSLFLDDFSQQVPIANKIDIRPVSLYAQTQTTKNGILINIKGGNNLYTYMLTKNQFYYLRFLFFGLIYLVNVLLILIPMRYQRFQARKEEKLRREISQLQLKLVNSGLEPHFVFNALNTVSSKILKGERLEAYDLLNNFSDLMRASTNFSEKECWTLKEELKFISDYLVLMKVRFSNRFEYELEINADAVFENARIPLLLVHNFVENAVKHAFTDISHLGRIDLKLRKEGKNIEIQIIDNGIGRNKANAFSSTSDKKSGKGIQMNAKQVELFNTLQDTEISFEIIDLFDGNTPAGTKVLITIPTKN